MVSLEWIRVWTGALWMRVVRRMEDWHTPPAMWNDKKINGKREENS